MKLHVVTGVVVLFCLVLATESQKIGQPLFCHGCVAVIKELHKVLKDSSGRKSAVSQAVSRLCQIDNFVSYTFSPPKMIKACNYIVETHHKELTESVANYYRKFRTADNLVLQEQFCEQAINACEGVRRPTKDSEMKPHGFSMDEANQKLNEAAQKSVTPSSLEDNAQIPKPPSHKATPHDEF